MPSFNAGMDYRAQPNIANYERYGFGPEASFFKPEYTGLVSAAAFPNVPAGTTPPAATPTYTPLVP